MTWPVAAVTSPPGDAPPCALPRKSAAADSAIAQALRDPGTRARRVPARGGSCLQQSPAASRKTRRKMRPSVPPLPQTLQKEHPDDERALQASDEEGCLPFLPLRSIAKRITAAPAPSSHVAQLRAPARG
eukprot:CAMPEP_0174903946 /NCGR_PEP_ID=MMETSP0167-20121228/46274_1 /TAXON_ID=38298 /ORGANISM="Rhodella maculata, Strain CCMP736" /LENGTH=129 /DNA_ID=CAMNT_0016146421 /DNA_START=350 /DNA_END=736 /DNA_ORIENTATION=+